MPDITTTVDGDFDPVIRKYQSAAQRLAAITRGMETSTIQGRAKQLEGQGALEGRFAGIPNAQDLARLQQFISLQSELQRRGARNVFDRAAAGAGLERGLGLRFGVAEEQEFRRRDLAQSGRVQTRNARGQFGPLSTPDGFAAAGAAPGILRGLGLDEDSDLYQRTLKDVLVRERESREEIIDLNQRILNEGERAQLAEQSALRRLRDALQARAAREAAGAAGTGGRSLLDLESEGRALRDKDKASQKVDDIEARKRLGVVDAEADAAAAQRHEATQARLLLNQRLASNREYIEAQAAVIASEKRLQASINQQAQQLLLQNPGESGPGTRFQRLQAEISRRSGGSPRLATDFQSAGQFFQSRLLTTAGFAASGFATYAIQAQIRELISEATELQTEFRIIEGVLDSVGQTGEGAFREVRQGVLDVARDTATAADEVAKIQRQLAGAFADENLRPDFDAAKGVSETAFKLARVTGLPGQEITDSLTSAILVFQREGETFNDTAKRISDTIVGLESRFGVMPTEIVRFTADLAPLAGELGFTAEALSTLGAAAQQASGLSGSALAEQFGRILPGLQQRASEVVALFAGVGADVQNELGQAFGGNDIQRALEILLDHYGELDSAAQNQLASLVGGRREAGAFFAVLNRGDAILQSLAGGSDQFAGSLEDRFSRVSESVGFSFERLERAVEELGIALFDSGLADALSTLADVGSVVVEVFGALFEGFTDLNDILGGIPAKIVGVALALEAMSRAGRLGGNLVSTFRGSGAAGGAAPAAFGLQDMAALQGVTLGGGPAALGQIAGRQQQIMQQTIVAQQRGFFQRLRGLSRFSGVAALGYGAGGYAAGAGLDALNLGGEGSNLDVGLSGALRGAGTGAAFGSLLGPAGAGVGAVVGAGIGALQGLNGRNAKEAIGRERRRAAEVYRYALQRIASESSNAAQVLRALNSNEGLSEHDQELLDDVVQRRVAEGDEVFIRASQGPGERLASRIEQEAAQRRLTYEEAVNAYNAGRGTQGDVIAAFTAELEAVQSLLDGAAAGGNDTTEFELQRLQVLADQAEFLAQAINRRFDLIDRTAEAFGGTSSGTGADLQRAQGRLAALQAAGADPAVLQDAAFAVLDAQRAILDREVSNTENLQEQIAVAQRGIAADTNASSVVAEGNIREAFGSGILDQLNVLLRASVRPVSTSGGINGIGQRTEAFREAQERLDELGLTDADVNAIIQSVIATGNAETTVVTRIEKNLSSRVLRLRQLATLNDTSKEAYGKAREELRAFQNLIGVIEGLAPPADILGDVEGLNDQADQEADDLELRIGQAYNAIARAEANGDPVRIAQLAIDAANLQIAFARRTGDQVAELQGIAALREAQNQLQDAQDAITIAQIEASGAGEDPLKQAAAALRGAQFAQQIAKGTEAQIRTAIERQQAEVAYRDAIRDIIRSRTDLVIAMAEAAGDDVAAAKGGLDLARQTLDRAQAEQAGEAAINDAQRQVIEAQARVRDATLATGRADIDFALEMGRITVGQAINQLQALLQIPELTEQQTRDILLKIQQLKDQLGSDLQFNLPSDLKLPTLYEARRLIDAQQGGVNYQAAQVTTNNNQVVNISVDGGNPQEVFDAVVAAVNAPPRSGDYAGLY